MIDDPIIYNFIANIKLQNVHFKEQNMMLKH